MELFDPAENRGQSKWSSYLMRSPKAGSVAADGAGSNSPFTSALLKNLTIPGLDIRIALGQVHDDVLRATGRSQEPYIYGALGGGTLALAPAH
jgi:uncharacterized caspase-like protein